MRVIISSLLLVLALHFLLNGVSFRKKINFKEENIKEENFEENIREEMTPEIECQESQVKSSNEYIDDKNDSNFQSNALDVNKFYKRNFQSLPNENDQITKDKPKTELLEPKVDEHSNQPVMWTYNNELVMNGGQLLDGVTGFDDTLDVYSSCGELSSFPEPSSKIDDDLRMGMGKINFERRRRT